MMWLLITDLGDEARSAVVSRVFPVGFPCPGDFPECRAAQCNASKVQHLHPFLYRRAILGERIKRGNCNDFCDSCLSRTPPLVRDVKTLYTVLQRGFSVGRADDILNSMLQLLPAGLRI